MSTDPAARPLEVLLERSHVSRAEDLPALLRELSPALGVQKVSAYVVDYQQRELVPLPDVAGTASPTEILSIESTLAGWAYRDVIIRRAAPSSLGEPWRLWLPLLDGTERVGVLHVQSLEPPDPAQEQLLVAVASLVAELIVSRSSYGDAIELARRRLPMSLSAELQWNLLPPLTYATPDVVISGVLEPSYDIGGDTFDYAVNGNVLHVGIFDAVGHGITAAQLAGLTMASYRNARRSGLDIVGTGTSIDRWVSHQFPESFVTGIIAELDIERGTIRFVNAGHPAPLLFRAGRWVKSLPDATRLPFGLGDGGEEAAVTEEALEPEDKVLFYSDGMVEARDASREEFGVERLADFMSRHLADKLPAPETMRRLVHRILDYQDDELQDDATAVLLDWGPGTGTWSLEWESS